MLTEKIKILAVQVHQVSPEKSSFKASAVLAGAALGGFLGGAAALIITALAEVEWSMRLVVAPQLALRFAILGAWIAVSFTQDDRDDVTPIPQPPIERAPLAGHLESPDHPRIAA